MPVTSFVWDRVGKNVLTEVDESGATIVEYTNEPNHFGELISQRRDSVDSFYHFDGQDSTRQLTSASEAETDSYFYSAYGETVATSGSTENSFRFKGAIGYYTDKETSGVYVRQRRFGPDIGRWISTDPLGFVDGPFLYLYCANNPVNCSDPSGTQTLQDPSDPERTRKCPQGHRWCCLKNATWRQCCKASDCRWWAIDIADTKYPNEGLRHNAYKHCLWSCCISEWFDDSKIARKITDLFELCTKGGRGDTCKDLHNNMLGAVMGRRRPPDCKRDCLRLLRPEGFQGNRLQIKPGCDEDQRTEDDIPDYCSLPKINPSDMKLGIRN